MNFIIKKFFVDQVKDSVKVWRVNILFERLKRVRLNAVRKLKGEKPIYSYSDYYYRLVRCITQSIKNTIRNAYTNVASRVTPVQRSIIKSSIAFIIGIALAWIAFLFVYHETDANTLHCTVLGVTLLFILSFGFSASQLIRNVVALSLPTLLSSKGRLIMLGYIYILTFNGPVKNMSRNMDELNRSIACGKQLAINITKETLEELFSPLLVAKNTIKNAVKSIKTFVLQIKEAFQRMKQLFSQITQSIRHIFKWLSSVVNVCNAKLGAPYERCKTAFRNAANDCKRKMKILKVVCNIVHAVEPICHIAKMGKILCEIPAIVKEIIIEKVNQAFRGFLDDIYNEFYVNVTLQHEYKYRLTKSSTYESVLESIKSDLHKKFAWIWNFVDIVSVLFTFLTLYIIIKACMYRSKYLIRDEFDNIYITKHFKQIDLERAKHSKETALPLNYRERKRYIYPLSWRMNATEKRKFSFGIISLFSAACQSLFFIAIDYCLYSIMTYIRHLLYTISILRLPARGELHVKGNGALASMYREIGDDLNPLSQIEFKREMDCAPTPFVPNFENYTRISFYLLLTLATVLGESYSLRTRHMVMGLFFPARNKERSAWLYNVILCQRGSFLKFMRRQIRRRVLGDTSIESVSFCERLTARYPLLRRLFASFQRKHTCCVMCATKQKSNEDNFINCENVNCSGIYCLNCFHELKNICTLCKRPVEYGDISDVSDERDSSDEELQFDYSEDWSYQDDIRSEPEPEPEPGIKSEDAQHVSYTNFSEHSEDNGQQLEEKSLLAN